MESRLRLGGRVFLSALLLLLGIAPLGVEPSSASVSPCPLRDPGPNSGWVRVPKDTRLVAEAVYLAAQQGFYRVWIGPGPHPIMERPPYVPEEVPLAGLYLEESFLICGMGPDFTFVEGSKEVSGPLISLLVDDGEIVLEGFTLTGGSWEWAKGSPLPPGLSVQGKRSRFILRNLRVFYTRLSPEIRISASGSEVLLEGVKVHGSGVKIWAGEVVISRSLISGNWDGISVSGSSKVTITQSRISGNRYRGISTDGRPHIIIRNSEIAYNGSSGIHLAADTHLEVNDSRIFANGGYGIRMVRKECGYPVDGAERVEVRGRGNEIFDNAKGDLCPEDYPWPEGFIRK